MSRKISHASLMPSTYVSPKWFPIYKSLTATKLSFESHSRWHASFFFYTSFIQCASCIKRKCSRDHKRKSFDDTFIDSKWRRTWWRHTSVENVANDVGNNDACRSCEKDWTTGEQGCHNILYQLTFDKRTFVIYILQSLGDLFFCVTS